MIEQKDYDDLKAQRDALLKEVQDLRGQLGTIEIQQVLERRKLQLTPQTSISIAPKQE